MIRRFVFSNEGLANFSGGKSVSGLFGMRQFHRPESLVSASYRLIDQCRPLIRQVVEPEGSARSTNSSASLIVKQLDLLSDMICSVIDSAELIRNVHPSADWQKAAMQTYSVLGTFINELNTHSGLFKALDSQLKDHAVRQQSKEWTEEEMAVARLFHTDFLKSGVQFLEDSGHKEDFIQLNDRIQSVGHEFASGNNYPHSVGGRRRQHSVRLLEDILKSRRRLASLLGHSSYSHFFVQDKMAKSPERVLAYLTHLSKVNQPRALQAYKNQYQKSNCRLDRQLVMQYFSLGSVMEGISSIFRQMFGISIQVVDTAPGEIWHPSVRRLDVFDCDNENRKLGTIYCDLFQRQASDYSSVEVGKCQNPSQFTVRCHRRIDDDLPECFSETHYEDMEYLGIYRDGKRRSFQLPVVVLSCNYPRPSDGQPCFLDWSGVETLFHEFGHALHSMLARTNFQHVAGTRCKIDFVETPSILMEFICRDPWAVQQYARHHITNQPLSYQDFTDFVNTNHPADDPLYQQDQIFYAILDQAYHSEWPSDGVNFDLDTSDIYRQLQNKYHVRPYNPGASNQTSFTHLFTYGAGYYSYLWCRSIASQVYQLHFRPAFETGNRETIRKAGDMWYQEILKYGGGKDPWNMNWHRVCDGKDIDQILYCR